jgi:hypothetical protein
MSWDERQAKDNIWLGDNAPPPPLFSSLPLRFQVWSRMELNGMELV